MDGRLVGPVPPAHGTRRATAAAGPQPPAHLTEAASAALAAAPAAPGRITQAAATSTAARTLADSSAPIRGRGSAAAAQANALSEAAGSEPADAAHGDCPPPAAPPPAAAGAAARATRPTAAAAAAGPGARLLQEAREAHGFNDPTIRRAAGLAPIAAATRATAGARAVPGSGMASPSMVATKASMALATANDLLGEAATAGDTATVFTPGAAAVFATRLSALMETGSDLLAPVHAVLAADATCVTYWDRAAGTFRTPPPVAAAAAAAAAPFTGVPRVTVIDLARAIKVVQTDARAAVATTSDTVQPDGAYEPTALLPLAEAAALLAPRAPHSRATPAYVSGFTAQVASPLHPSQLHALPPSGGSGTPRNHLLPAQLDATAARAYSHDITADMHALYAHSGGLLPQGVGLAEGPGGLNGVPTGLDPGGRHAGGHEGRRSLLGGVGGGNTSADYVYGGYGHGAAPGALPTAPRTTPHISSYLLEKAAAPPAQLTVSADGQILALKREARSVLTLADFFKSYKRLFETELAHCRESAQAFFEHILELWDTYPADALQRYEQAVRHKCTQVRPEIPLDAIHFHVGEWAKYLAPALQRTAPTSYAAAVTGGYGASAYAARAGGGARGARGGAARAQVADERPAKRQAPMPVCNSFNSPNGCYREHCAYTHTCLQCGNQQPEAGQCQYNCGPSFRPGGGGRGGGPRGGGRGGGGGNGGGRGTAPFRPQQGGGGMAARPSQ